MQSVSGNSGVLDTLDTKLRVEAYYQSGSLPPAVEQLESGVWHSQLPDPNVQLKAVPGSSVTTWSIPGVSRCEGTFPKSAGLAMLVEG